MDNIIISTNNWTVTKDHNNIAHACFARANARVNTLDDNSLTELAQILTKISAEKSITALVFTAAPEQGFIAGADIKAFITLDQPEDVKNLLLKGQTIFQQINDLPMPTIALINGFCLGGGLELALACKVRLALQDAKIRIGLPEVLLGIRPGWGGSIRLPNLIGANVALPMILQGRTINVWQAKKIGLIDDVIPVRSVHNAILYYAKKPSAYPSRRSLRDLFRANSWFNKIFNYSFTRKIYAEFAERKLQQKLDKKYYPAPYAILHSWQQHGTTTAAGYQAEVTDITQLLQHNTTKNLMHVFFLQEQAKKIAKANKFLLQHVHVIGAGTMGGDIAAWCTSRGLTVTLQDPVIANVGKAVKRAHALFANIYKQPHLYQDAKDRLIIDPAGDGLKSADIIIEAIIEDVKIKQNLFHDIEQKAKAEAIFATNTSSIPLDRIAQRMQHSERLVGLHFFNPVAKMQLVEVVQWPGANPDVVNRALAFAQHIGKLPIKVQNMPGFLVNRVLVPYLLEAMLMYQEGIPAETIDHAMRTFGMPMGPLELADIIGLDICLAVGNFFISVQGGAVPEVLNKKVTSGKLGRKTQAGFYTYQNGKKTNSSIPTASYQEDTTDRLLLTMLNECVACLREHVVDDQDSIDLGLIFGAGFAAYTGGPMHFIQHEGKEKFIAKLHNLTQRYGTRFTPDQYWQQL